jgi:hypothetical protein
MHYKGSAQKTRFKPTQEVIPARILVPVAINVGKKLHLNGFQRRAMDDIGALSSNARIRINNALKNFQLHRDNVASYI